MKRFVVLLFIVVIVIVFVKPLTHPVSTLQETLQTNMTEDEEGLPQAPHELTIMSLREGNYPGSDLTLDQTLSPGGNYTRSVVSYRSEGLKIYALLTVPDGDPPPGGWPAIIFNHGYIPPAQYRTTERYVAYTDAFSKNDYVLLRPDFRGHGNSEGEPTGAYGSNGYTIDVLNAVASIKKHPGVNPDAIGMWGHSMGGFITLRAMVVDKNIKAGVIWGGVVGSYADMLNNWRRRSTTPFPIPSGARRWRQMLIDSYGTPEQNPEFWASISTNAFLSDISGPLQLHHGTSDASVPVEFSQTLADQVKAVGKDVELFTYPGDDHNISKNFTTAISRSVKFFDQYLKR